MKTYEDYFARWRTLRAQEAQIGCQRSELEEEIVKQFSPYRKGEKIIVERGDKTGVDYGIITMVDYDQDSGINHAWLIYYKPLNANFALPKKRYNCRQANRFNTISVKVVAQ